MRFKMGDFKTFEFAEKNGDGVLIFAEEDEEQALRRLREVVKFPEFWRLSFEGLDLEWKRYLM
jgi:hypothetical protein